jgi:hypothetical protein
VQGRQILSRPRATWHFGYAEVHGQQATGNRQQATGNRQQATGNNYTLLLTNRVNHLTAVLATLVAIPIERLREAETILADKNHPNFIPSLFGKTPLYKAFLYSNLRSIT